MQRGDLYLVKNPGAGDLRRQRVFVIVSRQLLVDSRFSSVICAPVYSKYDGLATQVRIGIEEGLKHDSAIHCDELVSLPKTLLANYVGRLRERKVEELNRSLAEALGIDGLDYL